MAGTAVECGDCDGGGGGVTGTDHHSGYSTIPSGTTVTIVENKQSLTFGDLIIEGILIIEGQLIQEL